MQHPLVRPSLAPYAFAFSRQVKRLEYTSPSDPHYYNPERLMAKFWDGLHRIDAERPWPIETIIHVILPGMARSNALFTADFEFGGMPYNSRDIALLSTVVYWFGTSVGNALLEPRRDGVMSRPHIEPLRKRADDHPEREYLMKHRKQMLHTDFVKYVWAHTCVPACEKRGQPSFPADHCFYGDRIVPRDYAVVEGLMRWLGTLAGRAFIAVWREKVNAAHEKRMRKTMRSLGVSIAA